MILVNLLPENLRPIKRTPLPHLLSLAVLVLTVLALGWMYLAISGQIADKGTQLARAEQDLTALSDIVNEYNELSAKKQQLEDKIMVIEEILSDRIIWSEQLHHLAELTPENFWYQRIRETSKSVRVERVALDEKGQPVKEKDGSVKMVRENVKRAMLEISGFVVPDEQGSSAIYPLTDNTTQDEEFSDLFVLDSPQIMESEYNGFSVRGFVLEYRINRGGES